MAPSHSRSRLQAKARASPYHNFPYLDMIRKSESRKSDEYFLQTRRFGLYSQLRPGTIGILALPSGESCICVVLHTQFASKRLLEKKVKLKDSSPIPVMALGTHKQYWTNIWNISPVYEDHLQTIRKEAKIDRKPQWRKYIRSIDLLRKALVNESETGISLYQQFLFQADLIENEKTDPRNSNDHTVGKWTNYLGLTPEDSVKKQSRIFALQSKDIIEMRSTSNN
ncbi:hypothetical protein WICPIJ_003334 [Wickerhamomyces pijperi]|uniref:Uncharacterized protein n=1 Tax=Wickerhamomyces pijperi TaxID=599730 RepID=A0A9P8Q7U8_WICPI|nr:hypothetical protein WICPIJ_003334 [Wickerhamomyces pijperi]